MSSLFFQRPTLLVAENEGYFSLTEPYNEVCSNIPAVISQGHFAKVSTEP